MATGVPWAPGVRGPRSVLRHTLLPTPRGTRPQVSSLSRAARPSSFSPRPCQGTGHRAGLLTVLPT